MKKENLMPSVVLSAICLVAALLLSVINMFTAPEIAERENAKANEALVEVLPGGSNFKLITLNENYPKNIVEAYSADGGFVFRAVGAGRNGDIVVMVGIDTDGKIAGTKVITSGETPKYADPVYAEVEGTDGKYTGQTSDTFAPVIIANSTMTSNGFAGAIDAALKAYIVACGGQVDNRTPEEILQDNCNTALGTENVVFTKWFATEVIEGVDAVYEAADGLGRVFVIGEVFIGVNADGVVVNGDGADTTAIESANAIVSASRLTEVQKPNGVGRTVSKIYVTESGNYVFELLASGYQVLTDWGNGKEIEIKLSISADGKIIDCYTVDHAESKGYGDACATEDYYDQWRGQGKNDITISSEEPDSHIPGDLIPSDCTDIGAISSATFTTYGYQKAIKTAFDVFEMLSGGNQ